MSNPNLRSLGSQTFTPIRPEAATLESIPFDPVGAVSLRFTCPEFTSLCPVTGQPDFAMFIIDYIPRKHVVESKSLKLYMCSFRNEGQFHEEVTRRVFSDFDYASQAEWTRVAAFWYPRGGIPIDVVIQSGDIPPKWHVLPLPVHQYRGR